MAELLTSAEHEAIELLGKFWSLLCGEIVAPGPAADADLNEAIAHVHALQHTVMAQAASRAYPHRYRPLGGWTEHE